MLVNTYAKETIKKRLGFRWVTCIFVILCSWFESAFLNGCYLAFWWTILVKWQVYHDVIYVEIVIVYLLVEHNDFGLFLNHSFRRFFSATSKSFLLLYHWLLPFICACLRHRWLDRLYLLRLLKYLLLHLRHPVVLPLDAINMFLLYPNLMIMIWNSAHIH